MSAIPASAEETGPFHLHAYAQADHRIFLHGGNNSEIHKARLSATGKLDDFYYRYSSEFSSGIPETYDAFVGWHGPDTLNIRAGKSKVPVDLERLRPANNQTFTESSMTALMTPGRDIGLQMSKTVRKFLLHGGIFSGTPDNVRSDGTNDGRVEMVARAFYEWQPGLGFGMAGTYGNRLSKGSHRNLPSYQSPAREKFFTYNSTTNVDGNTWRLVPQGYYYHGSLGFLGQVALSSQHMRNGSDTASLVNTGWGVQIQYVLTGEDENYKTLKPEAPFNPANNQWGAWEIAARYGELNIDNDTFPLYADPALSAAKACNTAIALNGFLTDYLRVQMDFEHTGFDGGAASGDRKAENLMISRLTVEF
jgi:phosphate-selective porin OprO/OprP